MRKRIHHILNRKYPLFLLHVKGRIYYYRMIVFFILLINITLDLGFIKWDEYHKNIVLSVYIGLFFGLYVLTHRFLMYLRPRYFNPQQWTVRRECSVLLCWIPPTAVSTCLFAGISVPEFELSLTTILQLQFCNFILSLISIPTFGCFIDKKLIPVPSIEPFELIELAPAIEPTLLAEPKENTKTKSHLTEEQALKILQQLNELMETRQLYLSTTCLEQKVASCTNIPVHHISYVINTFTPYSFNDFVNKYRVKHACRILQNGPDKKLTLVSIGYECGFGSKVSFYAAFRKFTGQTPAEYLKQCERVTPSDALTKE